MKKIVALALTMMLVLAMGSVAMAEETTWAAVNLSAESKSAPKEFTLEGGTAYPAGITLSFTSQPDSANPDDTNVQVGQCVIGADGKGTITVTLPTYTKAGKYNYTITENDVGIQGVTKTTEKIGVSVVIGYDNANSALTLTGWNMFIKDSNGDKTEKVINKYSMGNLTLNKTVSGNMADETKYFKVKVEFTASQPVVTDISIADGSYASNPTTVPASDWSNGKASTEVWLKHGETLKFSNIPAGVSYSVTEDSAHTTGDLNGEEGYTASYTDETGEISANGTAAAKIKNEKSITPDTGITLESVPYIMILAVAMVGVMVIISRKRREEM